MWPLGKEEKIYRSKCSQRSFPSAQFHMSSYRHTKTKVRSVPMLWDWCTTGTMKLRKAQNKTTGGCRGLTPAGNQGPHSLRCVGLRNTGPVQSCSATGRKGQGTDAATHFPAAEMVFDQRQGLEITGREHRSRHFKCNSSLAWHISCKKPVPGPLPPHRHRRPPLQPWLFSTFTSGFLCTSRYTVSTQCYRPVHHKLQLDYRDCCI